MTATPTAARLLIVAAVAALSAGLTWLLMGPARARPESRSALASGDSELAARLDRLERALPALASRRGATAENTAAGSPAALADEPSGVDVDQARDPERERALAEERLERRMAFIQSTFAAEPRDPRWASDAGNEIRDAVSAPEFARSRVTEIDCRTTLCRLQIEHASTAARERFVVEMPTRLPSLPRATTRFLPEGDDGTSLAIMYLVRQGERMPAPPQ